VRSSNQPGSPGAKRSCPSSEESERETPMRSCSGWGLPCGPCRQCPGALLPHPFTLACAPKLPKEHAPSAVYSLWHFPCARDRNPCHGGRYPPPLFRGARTFLDILSDDAAARLPGNQSDSADGAFAQRHMSAAIKTRIAQHTGHRLPVPVPHTSRWALRPYRLPDQAFRQFPLAWHRACVRPPRGR